MKTIKVDFKNPERAILEKAAEIIKQDSAVVYPTDTVYGLGVNALSQKALKRLFLIKKRPLKKPISIIVRDIKMAKKLAFIDEKQEKIFKKLLPGPLTLILKKKKVLPAILTAGRNTVGIRIPACLVTQILMEYLSFPLTTTSANIAGKLPFSCAKDAIDCWQKNSPQPDLILDAGCLSRTIRAKRGLVRGRHPNPPSTILDLTGPKPKILRQGSISEKFLQKFLK